MNQKDYPQYPVNVKIFSILHFDHYPCVNFFLVTHNLVPGRLQMFIWVRDKETFIKI